MTDTYDASGLSSGWTVQQSPCQPPGKPWSWNAPVADVPDGPHKLYDYTQTTPATTWTIVHNLNTHPLVEITGPDNSNWIPDVEYVDRNTLILYFAIPTSGEAHLS